MPPRKSDQRKSDVSTTRFALVDDAQPSESVEVAAGPAETSPKGPSQKTPVGQEKEKDKGKDHKDAVTIEDLALPKSIIARLAKGALPPNTQIQANAMLALNRSATVIINYLASHANEHTINANRKTISPDDVFKALADVDMSFMKESLEREFEVFNSIQTEKRTSYRQKVRAAKQAPDGPSGADADMADVSANDVPAASDEPSGPRVAKKARVEAPTAGGAEEADDAETEDEPEMEEDEDDDEDEVDEEEEEEDDEQGGGASADETQDALEERKSRQDGDEAVDDDDSD